MDYSACQIRKKILYILAFFPVAALGQTREITLLQKKLPLVQDSADYVDGLNRIGMLMHLKSPDSCIFYGMKSRRIAGRIGYAKGATDADNVIGIALALKGLTNEALDVFSRTLVSYRSMGDTAGEAQVYMNFASASMQLGREADAVRYSRLALRKGSAIPSDSIMGKVYTNYCIAYPGLSEDSVMYYISRSNAIAHRLHDQQLLIGNRQVLALFYLSRGRQAEALPLLLSSYSDSKKAQLERLQIISLNLLAEYHAPERPELALSLSERQYRLAVAKGYDDTQVEILLGMQRYAQLAGSTQKGHDIDKMLVAALMDRQWRLGKFIGDYVSYGKLQDDYDGLERSEKYSRRTSLVLACASIAGIILSALLLRAHLNTRRESRKKTTLNALIEEQNSKLRGADEFKSRLVSILAHDFRSPLISTLSLIRLLESEKSMDEADKAGFYKMLEGDISGLLGQFDLTLQWIRQQLRGEVAATEPVDVRELFLECAVIFSVQLREKDVIAVNNIPKGILLHTDREMLQFVNRNLLSNALKFSPAGAVVSIEASIDGALLVVTVSDSGPGISDEKMEQLFSISDAGGSTERGAGIALSMSRDFIETLGGRIWAERGKEKGSNFCYSLPL